jgi:hypothetical protein
MSRRKFLQIASVLAGVGITAYASMSLGMKRVINARRALVLDTNAPTGNLSEQDMQTTIALLEVLLPEMLWPGREAMIAMVHQATEHDRGVLKEYQAGLSFLEQSTRKSGMQTRFADTGIEGRQHILESILQRYPKAKPGTLVHYKGKVYRGLEWLFQSESQHRFREFVVRDLLSRFYSGSMAWKMAGYLRSPGLPGNPREYVQPLNR